MIDEWKRERSELDNKLKAVRGYIATHPNKDKYQGSRAKLLILQNDICVRRLAVHQKILQYEDEERLTEIFANISGLSDTEAASLMRDMERLKLVRV
jgi:hypothetical protein